MNKKKTAIFEKFHFSAGKWWRTINQEWSTKLCGLVETATKHWWKNKADDPSMELLNDMMFQNDVSFIGRRSDRHEENAAITKAFIIPCWQIHNAINHPNIESFMKTYPEFVGKEIQEKRILQGIANVIGLMAKVFPPSHSKCFIMQTATQIVEGGDIRYITGGGMISQSEDRHVIFSRETGIPRRPRKEPSTTSSATKKKQKKKRQKKKAAAEGGQQQQQGELKKKKKKKRGTDHLVSQNGVSNPYLNYYDNPYISSPSQTPPYHSSSSSSTNPPSSRIQGGNPNSSIYHFEGEGRRRRRNMVDEEELDGDNGRNKSNGSRRQPHRRTKESVPLWYEEEEDYLNALLYERKKLMGGRKPSTIIRPGHRFIPPHPSLASSKSSNQLPQPILSSSSSNPQSNRVSSPGQENAEWLLSPALMNTFNVNTPVFNGEMIPPSSSNSLLSLQSPPRSGPPQPSPLDILSHVASSEMDSSSSSSTMVENEGKRVDGGPRKSNHQDKKEDEVGSEEDLLFQESKSAAYGGNKSTSSSSSITPIVTTGTPLSTIHLSRGRMDHPSPITTPGCGISGELTKQGLCWDQSHDEVEEFFDSEMDYKEEAVEKNKNESSKKLKRECPSSNHSFKTEDASPLLLRRNLSHPDAILSKMNVHSFSIIPSDSSPHLTVSHSVNGEPEKKLYPPPKKTKRRNREDGVVGLSSPGDNQGCNKKRRMANSKANNMYYLSPLFYNQSLDEDTLSDIFPSQHTNNQDNTTSSNVHDDQSSTNSLETIESISPDHISSPPPSISKQHSSSTSSSSSSSSISRKIPRNLIPPKVPNRKKMRNLGLRPPSSIPFKSPLITIDSHIFSPQMDNSSSTLQINISSSTPSSSSSDLPL